MFESRQKRIRTFTGCETVKESFVGPQREKIVIFFFSLYLIFLDQSINENLLFQKITNATMANKFVSAPTGHE